MMDLFAAFGAMLVIAMILGTLIVYALTSSPRADDRRRDRHHDRRAQATKRHTGGCGCTCGVCRAPISGGHDAWFKQHTCQGFGRLACCGYALMTSSGSDAFTHFCPPTIARQQLAVEREMDRQRQDRDSAPES